MREGWGKIVAKEGFGGLYKGLYPLWARQIPYNITTQEANTSLRQLAILLLGFAHSAVDDLDRLLANPRRSMAN
jgi:predicted MPP superfamily phosphohydrolase